MIDPAYVRTMAAYNKWQNDGYRKLVEGLGEAELTQDRGAFFGSIFGTLNHLLWGDIIWMSRFDGGPGPEVPSAESTRLTPTIAEWATRRFQTDGRIDTWARGLHAIDLAGDLAWYSGLLGREMSMPKARCVVHFFNHQTHHRGQLHAMLTAAGLRPQDTDLILMPEGRG